LRFPNLDDLDPITRSAVDASIPLTRHILAEAVKWLRSVLDILRELSAGMSTEETRWRVLSADTQGLLGRRYPAEGFVYQPHAWSKILNARPDLAVEQNWTFEHPGFAALDGQEASDLIDFLNIIGFLPGSPGWADYNLARLKDGRLGWMPPAARVGDRVCVLAATLVPHCVRYVAGGKYKIIGICYVHDMMDGAAMPRDPDEFVEV